MTPTASLVFWLSLVVLSLVFLAIAYTLWRGKEYPRLRVRSLFGVTEGAESVEIKLPAMFDISHWKEVLDFFAVDPRPILFITKATEGEHIKDVKFPRFFEGMAKIGVWRGAFHFHRKSITAAKQVKNFCDYVAPLLTEKDFIILDVEEGGESAAQLKAWIQGVRQKYPNNRYMLYGRREQLNQIPMTADERAFFRTIPIWAAGYPYFPNLFSSIPSWYVPDQNKYGEVWAWQYSEKGVVKGIQGAVDLNWISPALQQVLGGDPPPPPEPEEPMTLYGTVIVSSLNVRSGPGANYQDVGDLLIGDKVEASENVGGWWKLSKVTRGSTNMPLPLANCYASTNNGLYIRTDPAPAPTPAPAVVRVSLEQRITAEIAGVRYVATVNVEDVEMVRE